MSVPPITPAAAGLRVQVVAEAEAGLMAAVDAAVQAARPALPATSARPTDPIAEAVIEARAAAAGRQGSLAPAFADLAQALTRGQLPEPVREAAAWVLALRLGADGPVTAETVRAAVARSGLFLESRLAATPVGAEAPPLDLKAALLVLQRALAPITPREPRTKPAAAPPPVRAAALAGQPAEAPDLPKAAGAILAHLRGEVEQAIARQTLHQLASLPDGAGTAWMFELPVATPQGTAIAQFEIDRDGQGVDAPEPVWRARFSMDVEPLGPIHVHLSLASDRSAVTLWAEREDAAEHLRAEGGTLARALDAEVAFHAGAPRHAAPPAGRFVDRAS